jgi:flagella basal body P-ring formation protein FlgA
MNRLALTSWFVQLLGRIGLCLSLVGVVTAQAQEVLAASALQELTQQWIDAALSQSASAEASPLRMEVSLGQLDSRLHLAPCARIEPYLPVNTRLWGQTRIGLRCLQGKTRWNVFLPVTVKAFGPAWVLRGAVLPGSTLKVQDATAGEVDWASDASPVLADPALWVGQVAAYPLLAGQPLRLVMLRPAQAFAAGAAVRLLTEGSGFSVSSDGQALSNGVVGQVARVRTEAGRVVSGVVLDGRTVKIAL